MLQITDRAAQAFSSINYFNQHGHRLHCLVIGRYLISRGVFPCPAAKWQVGNSPSGEYPLSPPKPLCAARLHFSTQNRCKFAQTLQQLSDLGKLTGWGQSAAGGVS